MSLKEDLLHLSEECHELGKAACKCSRFGPHATKHAWSDTNFNHLRDEFEDVKTLFKKIEKEVESKMTEAERIKYYK